MKNNKFYSNKPYKFYEPYMKKLEKKKKEETNFREVPVTPEESVTDKGFHQSMMKQAKSIIMDDFQYLSTVNTVGKDNEPSQVSDYDYLADIEKETYSKLTTEKIKTFIESSYAYGDTITNSYKRPSDYTIENSIVPSNTRLIEKIKELYRENNDNDQFIEGYNCALDELIDYINNEKSQY